MNILITGGYGFVGNSLIKTLAQDDDVNLIVVVDSNGAGKVFYKSIKIRSYTFNFNRYDFLTDVLKNYNITHVINLSASNNITDISYLSDLKVLLDACADNDIQHLHHTYSDDVVHYSDDLIITENVNLCKTSIHSFVQSTALELVLAFNNINLKTSASLSCNLYGPHQQHNKFITKSINCIKANNKITIHDSGDNIRNWLHVDDYSKALVSCVKSSNLTGQNIVISSNEDITNNEVIEMICKQLNLNVKTNVSYVESTDKNAYRKVFRSYKKSNLIQWLPSISFEEGIKTFV
jgi:dTDP-glucose 4,6-dehydratase